MIYGNLFCKKNYRNIRAPAVISTFSERKPTHINKRR